MTTSGLTIRSLASDPRLSVRRVLHQHRFTRWCTTAQATADYLSILAGTWAGLLVYQRLHVGIRPDPSTLSEPSLAAAIAALSVFQLCIVDVRGVEFSPLDIRRSEHLVRSTLCVIATLFAFGCCLHRDTSSSFITGTIVVCVFLTQRKVSDSLMVRARVMLGYKARAAIYGNKCNACSLAVQFGVDRVNWIWVGSIQKKSESEATNFETCGTTLGCWEDLDSIVAEYGITEIAVAESELAPAELREVLHDCVRLNLGLSVLAAEHHAPAYCIENTCIDGRPGWRFAACNAPHPIGTVAKRVFDISLSVALLILLLPLFLLVSAFVVLDSPGPIFFRHRRVGRNGDAFTMWKFRSMNTDAAIYECSPSSDSDPRLTNVGRFLRRFSVDELPQLFNVIKGDMSLVGPRPEMPFIVEQYGPLERLRLRAKPGMTGLWQISPARAMPIHAHMEYDLFYIARQNFFLDLAILFRTFGAVFRGMEPTVEGSQSKMDEISETEVNA